jgi:hypothetical protein
VEKVGRTLAVADVDNDGDLDLLITNNGDTPDLLRNDSRQAGNSIIIRTVGTRSNRDGIGARLRVTAAGRTQMREVKAGSGYLGQSDTRVHVGLGRTARIDRLEIQWPAGSTEVIQDVPVNQIVTVTEGQGITARIAFTRRAR